MTAAAPDDAARKPVPQYWLTRFVLLRLLGCVYAVAFLAAARQLVPLIGAHGLLPLPAFLTQAAAALGGRGAAFLKLPSLFWLASSDGALRAVAWSGFALSLVVVAGYANAIVLGVLWALYMSIVHVGQEWYGYGWEIQLLETGFLALFFVPLLDGRPFPRRAPPIVVIWLFRWLAFRIMLGAGLIKLRGDAGWRDLTALYYHFETQPIPGPLSRWFHFLPRGVLRAGVVFNHLAEVVAPWFVFWPRLGRHLAGAVIVAFQLTLIASGNLSFLNWLTIVPALACFDDGLWRRVLPRALVRRAEAAALAAQPSRAYQRTTWALAALVGLLSVQPVLNLFATRQIMNTSFDSLDLVNTYGAFGTVGRERLTLVFEGSDGDQWRSYRYRAQPIVLKQRPVQIAPYQPRLDWAMWFAAMSTPDQYPWTLQVVWKLLHNDPGTLSLFGDNPFPAHPPRYVRAELYRYRFAPASSGAFWTREDVGTWLPAMSVDNADLQRALEQLGWRD